MTADQIRRELAIADERGQAREPYMTNRMLTEIAAQLSDIANGIDALTATLERIADK